MNSLRLIAIPGLVQYTLRIALAILRSQDLGDGEYPLRSEKKESGRSRNEIDVNGRKVRILGPVLGSRVTLHQIITPLSHESLT